MSKVSALVSAYYAEEYLNARLVNLMGITDVEVEPIVICQKGSVENEIARLYNVKIVHTDDIPTIGRAWNLGIEQATGDYLTTANTDDMFHERGLKTMTDALDEHEEIDLVFAKVHLFVGKQIIPWNRIDRKTGEIKDIRRLLFERCVIGPMPLWRKSVHDKIGLFDESYQVASDYEFWLRMAKAGSRFWYINASCGIYQKRLDSLEHRNKHILGLESTKARKA